MDASVHGNSNPTFILNLQLANFVFDMFHSEHNFDQSSSFTVERPAYSASVEKKIPLMCQDISVICELERLVTDRKMGLMSYSFYAYLLISYLSQVGLYFTAHVDFISCSMLKLLK